MAKHIHWYPGHIAKAQRQLKEKLNLVDVIIEVIDARIPYSSKYKKINDLCMNKPRLMLMNKSDVSDDNYNKIWASYYKKETGCDVIVTNLSNKSDIKLIIDKLIVLSKDVMQKRIQKGLLPRPVRTMVIGMPNVGKSSTINRLVNKSKAKTGAKAGVTKEQQWVRINDKVELLDTPGIIPTVQDDQFQALKLAMVNSIGENAYDSEYVAQKLVYLLCEKYNNEIRNYYGFEDSENMDLETIAYKKNWIIKGNLPDIKRTAQYVLSAFRNGKIGKFTLETPDDCAII